MDCPSQGAGPRALELRGYQRECVEAVERAGDGRHLVVMATGLGKTVTFAALPRRGRTLILSHRDELVRQPERYFDCPFGVEKAGERSHGRRSSPPPCRPFPVRRAFRASSRATSTS